MEKDDFQANLARALNDSLELSEVAKRAEIEKRAAERLHALVRIAAGRERIKARRGFGWACFFLSLVVVLFAIYMRFDDRQRDSLVTLMLSLIPLLGGGWHLQRANTAELKWASELERLDAADSD